MADEDQELETIALRARSDRDAFAQLFDRLYDPVFRYVRAQVSDHATAEDLCSQVFLDAFRTIGGYRPRGGGVRAWLFRMARNDVLDHFRHVRRLPFATLNHEPADAAAPGPEERAVAHEEAELVRRAVATLGDEQREVVLLKFGAGLSNGDVARVLGKSEGAIKALQHRALDKLAERLDEGADD